MTDGTMVQHAPREAVGALTEQGFRRLRPDECPICLERGFVQARHDDILVQFAESGELSRIAVLWDGTPGVSDVLAILSLQGEFSGPVQPYAFAVMELAHRVDAGGVTLPTEPSGLALQWFLHFRDEALRGVEAYESEAALWRKYFANQVPGEEFIACASEDEAWQRALDAVEVRDVEDDVVFMSTPIQGMHHWYRLRWPEPRPVVVVHNSDTGLVTVSAPTKEEAVRLFGNGGLKVVEAVLGSTWGGNVDKLATSRPMGRERAVEIASLIAMCILLS